MIFAGIYSRHIDRPIRQSDCMALSALISRNPRDKVSHFEHPRMYIASMDTGALRESGIWFDDDFSISILSGEPLFSSTDLSVIKGGQLESLHLAWKANNWHNLEKTTGVFCAAHFNAQRHALTLVTDKLGIRPIYYWQSEEYVVFSTALRIIEGFHLIPKTMDVRAVAEIVAFDFPLADRTPYSNIYTLRAGEIVEFFQSRISRRYYWRWDTLENRAMSEHELSEATYNTFKDAVKRRARDDSTAVAFLSGGLDSRCVVGMLRFLNVKVRAINFSIPQTEDWVFASEFAEKAEIIITHQPFETGKTWSMRASEVLSSPFGLDNLKSHTGYTLWSGDGGSVGLGHVYMNQVLVDMIRSEKDPSHSVDYFLAQEKIAVPVGLMNPRIASRLIELPRIGILEELNKLECSDPGRRFHLFLMLNDQRRHLAQHFEDIDLHQIELQLPFFDSDFLSIIVANPVDIFLYHRFYNKWLDNFPSAVTSVPWQAYPSHVPCPIQVPKPAGSQWDRQTMRTLANQEKPELISHISSLLKAKDFPYDLLQRHRLLAANLIWRLGFADYTYVMKTALIYYRYWVISEGKYQLP